MPFSIPSFVTSAALHRETKEEIKMQKVAEQYLLSYQQRKLVHKAVHKSQIYIASVREPTHPSFSSSRYSALHWSPPVACEWLIQFQMIHVNKLWRSALPLPQT